MSLRVSRNTYNPKPEDAYCRETVAQRAGILARIDCVSSAFIVRRAGTEQVSDPADRADQLAMPTQLFP